MPIRLYIERYAEHRAAFEYLANLQKKFPSQGSKTIVRAILKYRDEVEEPLGRWEKDKRSRKPSGSSLALKKFKELGGSKTKAKQVSLRLAIDRWAEHRAAFRFLNDYQKKSGQANDLIIRSILYYKKSYPVGRKK